MSVSHPDSLDTAQLLQWLLRELDHTLIMAATLVSFVGVSMILRVYVRLRMVRQFGPDDWSQIVAVTLYFASAACLFAGESIGRRIIEAQDWHSSGVQVYLKLYKTVYTTWSLGLIATKFAIGFFFLRILGHIPIKRAVIWTLMGLTTVTGLAYCVLISATCVDIAAGDPTKPRCDLQRAGGALLSTYSGVNILADVVLTVMGIQAIWTSKINTYTKAVACLLVALGSVGAVASAVRLAIAIGPSTTSNYLNQLFGTARWCQIELSTAIIASNLAMIRPLFQLFLSKIGLSSAVIAGTFSSRKNTGGVAGAAGGATGGGARDSRRMTRTPLRAASRASTIVRGDKFVLLEEVRPSHLHWDDVEGGDAVGYEPKKQSVVTVCSGGGSPPPGHFYDH